MNDQIKPIIRISTAKKVYDIQDAVTLPLQDGQAMPTTFHAMKGRLKRQAGIIKLSWNKLG